MLPLILAATEVQITRFVQASEAQKFLEQSFQGLKNPEAVEWLKGGLNLQVNSILGLGLPG